MEEVSIHQRLETRHCPSGKDIEGTRAETSILRNISLLLERFDKELLRFRKGIPSP